MLATDHLFGFISARDLNLEDHRKREWLSTLYWIVLIDHHVTQIYHWAGRQIGEDGGPCKESEHYPAPRVLASRNTEMKKIVSPEIYHNHSFHNDLSGYLLF